MQVYNMCSDWLLCTCVSIYKPASNNLRYEIFTKMRKDNVNYLLLNSYICSFLRWSLLNVLHCSENVHFDGCDQQHIVRHTLPIIASKYWFFT